MEKKEEAPEKKQDITIVVVNFVKDLVKGRVRNAIYAGLTVLCTWGWASYQSKVEEIKLIASMPAKYTQLLENRTTDSLFAIQQLKEVRKKDSIQDAAISKMQHKYDSAVEIHARWLQDDIDSIFVINKKLIRNKIK